MRTNILVVGGAGYIGSHMVLALRKAGYEPIVLDNLSKGHREAVIDAELIVGDMADTNLLSQIFSKYSFAAVMHFASFIEVGESMQMPLSYYLNNVAATLNLIKMMLAHNVKNLIFSSSAAVYGKPTTKTIKETHRLAPVSVYGRSKLMVEEMIKDIAQSDGLRYFILRYFNAAGADVSGKLCERHHPESHLIPLTLQVIAGKRKNLTIFGNDYPTFDGTCIRDYVHVTDLCHAHLLALQKLLNEHTNVICNIGTGTGYSVLQVVHEVSNVAKMPIPLDFGPKRSGDVAILVANVAASKQIFNWSPQFSSLTNIISHALKAFNHS